MSTATRRRTPTRTPRTSRNTTTGNEAERDNQMNEMTTPAALAPVQESKMEVQQQEVVSTPAPEAAVVPEVPAIPAVETEDVSVVMPEAAQAEVAPVEATVAEAPAEVPVTAGTAQEVADVAAPEVVEAVAESADVAVVPVAEEAAPAKGKKARARVEKTKADKPEKSDKPVKGKAKAEKSEKPKKTEKKEEKAKPVKPAKLMRDSFTMPENEYAQFDALKKRLLAQGVAAKKSELLRAGIALLASLDDAALQDTVQRVEIIKTGRPAKHK